VKRYGDFRPITEKYGSIPMVDAQLSTAPDGQEHARRRSWCSRETDKDEPVSLLEWERWAADNTEMQEATKGHRKCWKCNKKLGVCDGVKCKCGYTFCSRHRGLMSHKCKWDYHETPDLPKHVDSHNLKERID